MKESLNPKKLGPLDKAKRIARAGALAMGLLSTSSEASGQEVPKTDQDTVHMYSEAEIQEMNNEKDKLVLAMEKEGYWLELSTKEAVERFPEYASRDFAQHVLEYHLENDPVSFLKRANFLKTYIGYKVILEKAVRRVGEDDGYYVELLEEKTIGIYKELDNYEQFLEDAAKKALENNERSVIIANVDSLFKHLSTTSAEYLFRKAVYAQLDRDPLFLILRFGVIKKYLSDSERIFDESIEKSIEKDPLSHLTGALFRTQNEENIFSKEKFESLINKIVEMSPKSFIWLFSYGKNTIGYETIFQTNPYLFSQLESISEYKGISSQEKELAAMFVDALIFDKHLTIEELVKIIRDPVKAKVLAEEILSHKNCIGRKDLEKYLSFVSEV